MPDYKETFKNELTLIKNDHVRDFVHATFEKFTPDYFWTAPASTSGKYHPEISLGVGGLVRHTKLAVWWGVELYSAYPYHDAFTISQVVAALLLHDLTKQSGGTAGHGVKFAGELRDQADYIKDEDPTPPTVLIIQGIESHMGIWTKPEMSKPNRRRPGYQREFCQLVHMADYCASRKVDAFVAGLA